MNPFENSYVELHNNVGKLFINEKEIISFNYENDGWYGFKFKKKNWDLNIWENEDLNILQASVYRVIKGDTKTDTWYNIQIKQI